MLLLRLKDYLLDKLHPVEEELYIPDNRMDIYRRERNISVNDWLDHDYITTTITERFNYKHWDKVKQARDNQFIPS